MSDNNDNNFIEPTPWNDELEATASKQLIDWVGKNCKGNPTISKESIIDSIQVDVDLPNTHSTMEAIFDLPDGKKFKGYPAMVDFFENLGYKGFPEHDMPDILNPAIEAEDITTEERAEHNEYLKEIQGENTDLDGSLDQEIANDNATQAGETNTPEITEDKNQDESNPGDDLNSDSDDVLASEELSGESTSEEQSSDEQVADEFSEDDLSKYADMADRAAAGEDVGVNVGSDAGTQENTSQSDAAPQNNEPKAEDDSGFAVDMDVEAKDIQNETDAANEKVKKADENKDPNKDPDKDKEQQQRKGQAPRGGSPAGLGAGLVDLAKFAGKGLGGAFGLGKSVLKSPFTGASAAYGLGKSIKEKSAHKKAMAGDPRNNLFAEAKVKQVDRAKNKVLDNLSLMSSGLNAKGEPASEIEKSSMRSLLSTQIQDYGNRLQEATEQLGNPDLGMKQKQELMGSIKESNEVLKSLDGEDSEEGNKLKEQTKNILKAISKLLKALFGRGKEAEPAAAM